MSNTPWSDAFKAHRKEEGTRIISSDGEEIPLILTYMEVREAAKNWEKFSSNAPFRVPIPSEAHARSVPQIPIEMDPPKHTAYRHLLDPIFRQPLKPEYTARIDSLVDEQLKESLAEERTDIVHKFALPIQSRALTYLLNMPASEADLWISWGTSLFHDGDSVEKGAHVDAYIKTQIKRVRTEPEAEDFFAQLTRMKIEGRPLNDDEILGIANLTFAGGRDTVINAIGFIIGYFATRRDELEMAASSSRHLNLATEEFVRVLSPLTLIGRVCPHGAEIGSAKAKVEPQHRAGLCWASANYDETVFEDPETFQIDRSPNPHIGFGSGNHRCMGTPQARAIMRSLIRALAEHTQSIEIVSHQDQIEQGAGYKRWTGYKYLIVRFT